MCVLEIILSGQGVVKVIVYITLSRLYIMLRKLVRNKKYINQNAVSS